MTVVTNLHKTFILLIFVMSWLSRCHVSLIHTPSGEVLPIMYSLLSKPDGRQSMQPVVRITGSVHQLLSSISPHCSRRKCVFVTYEHGWRKMWRSFRTG